MLLQKSLRSCKSDVRISSSNSWSLCASVEFPGMLDSSWVPVDEFMDTLEEMVSEDALIGTELTSLLVGLK